MENSFFDVTNRLLLLFFRQKQSDWLENLRKTRTCSFGLVVGSGNVFIDLLGKSKSPFVQCPQSINRFRFFFCVSTYYSSFYKIQLLVQVKQNNFFFIVAVRRNIFRICLLYLHSYFTIQLLSSSKLKHATFLSLQFIT